YNRSAAITPKHIHHRTLTGGAEFGRFVDDLVHVFYIDEEAGRRSAYALRAPLSHRIILGAKHQSRAAKCEFSMNRFSIGTLHDGAFRKTKRLLVKAHCSLDIGDREH